MSNMKRVLETIANLKVGVSVEQAFLEGVYEGLDLSSELLDDLLADEVAQEASDYLMDAQFEDTVFEIVTLDEDGEDAAMIGVTWNWSDAVETAILESALSDSLVMVKTVDSNTDRILFTKIFGGQF